MPASCAFGCEFNPDVPLHRFPNLNRFPDRFKVWVSLLGGKLETAADYERFKNKRVCDVHFTIEHKNRNRRLNALAVPSLQTPVLVSSSQEVADGKTVNLSEESAPREQVTQNVSELHSPTLEQRLREVNQNQHNIDLDTSHMIAIGHSTVNVVHETLKTGQDDTCQSPCPSPEMDDVLEKETKNFRKTEQDNTYESPCPSPDMDDEPEKEIKHLRAVTCDQCHQVVEGYRWVCVSCSGAVVCGGCVSHGVHPTCYVLRVPPLRPQWEVQAVLRAVRQALAVSSFADRLAEPLCDYDIAQDLSDEIKVKSEEDFIGSKLNSMKNEEEPVVEAVKADSQSDVGPDPLASPAKKTASPFGIKRKASFEEQSSNNMTKTCDMNSETESLTHAISHEGSDLDATDSEAGAGKVNTKTNVTGKLSLHLRDPQSSDKLAELSSNWMNLKRVRLSDVKCSIPTNSKTPSNVGVSSDKFKSVIPKMEYKTSSDVKVTLVRLGPLSSNKELGSCEKTIFRKPRILCGNRQLQSNVASAKSPTTKPGLVNNVSTKPGLVTNVSTKPGLVTNVSTKPGLVTNVSTKPGLVTNVSTNPRLVINVSTRVGSLHTALPRTLSEETSVPIRTSSNVLKKTYSKIPR